MTVQKQKQTTTQSTASFIENDLLLKTKQSDELDKALSSRVDLWWKTKNLFILQCPSGALLLRLALLWKTPHDSQQSEPLMLSKVQLKSHPDSEQPHCKHLFCPRDTDHYYFL